MKNFRKIIIMLALLAAGPTLCFAQYFQNLFDIDSTYDWGWDIFVNPDGSYFVMGVSQLSISGDLILGNVTILGDGSSITNKNLIVRSGFDIYNGGFSGQAKRISNGEFLIPLCIQQYDSSLLRSSCGFAKLKPWGDTIFVKTYTNQLEYFDDFYTCAVLADGSFLGGGEHATYTNPHYPGYIVHTDSLGDTLWTRTYQYDTSQWAIVLDIIPLSDGRIAVGAQTTYWAFDSGDAYTHNAPWFMLLDSNGNILRDTVYSLGYAGGGFLFKDTVGGYLHFGAIDTFITRFPLDVGNFPEYITHLDTNFRMDWLTSLPYDYYFGARDIAKAIQLHDGNFVVAGDAFGDTADTKYYNTQAWAAKINRTDGSIMWQQYYVSDSAHNAYFRDVAEKPDGSLVFIGAAFNDTCPAWHQTQDVWIVGTDGNGCLQPGCSSNTSDAVPYVPPVAAAARPFSVFPNPTADGLLTAQSPGTGTFAVYTVEGQQVAQYSIVAGNKSLQLPFNLAAGTYVGVYRPSGGGGSTNVRIVYQPN